MHRRKLPMLIFISLARRPQKKKRFGLCNLDSFWTNFYWTTKIHEVESLWRTEISQRRESTWSQSPATENESPLKTTHTHTDRHTLCGVSGTFFAKSKSRSVGTLQALPGPESFWPAVHARSHAPREELSGFNGCQTPLSFLAVSFVGLVVV